MRLLLRNDAAYIAEPLLRIAPREASHQNNPTNWAMRQEYELIYALNTTRRFPNDPRSAAALRREITPLLWRQRLWSLAWCAYHARFRAVLKGLAYVARNLSILSAQPIDRVAEWEDVATKVGG